ncbi:UPF0489 family protein [Fictibacillus phosphorivorans]|uniref:UPF0489 family protein n=1 Tax=Fictibacillus phosphorivorans TaxID=1221500 RepID=UPI0011A9C9C8|nr:UPF0489 family protein [Fictibacillus phosphorivorans]
MHEVEINKIIRSVISDNKRYFFPKQKIFLMKDHNWAFAAWEVARLRKLINKGASLFHIDAHLDYCEPYGTVEKITSYDDAIIEASKLEIAEFIIPSMKNGTLKNLFFISDDRNVTLDEKINRAYTLNHFEDEYKNHWYKLSENTSTILDLDLDYFNTNYMDYNSNSVLMHENIIRHQLNHFYKYMLPWDIVTVAVSPEHCGGAKEAIYLLKLFFEEFNVNLNKYEEW